MAVIKRDAEGKIVEYEADRSPAQAPGTTAVVVAASVTFATLADVERERRRRLYTARTEHQAARAAAQKVAAHVVGPAIQARDARVAELRRALDARKVALKDDERRELIAAERAVRAKFARELAAAESGYETAKQAAHEASKDTVTQGEVALQAALVEADQALVAREAALEAWRKNEESALRNRERVLAAEREKAAATAPQSSP